jgi:hypothetical protein
MTSTELVSAVISKLECQTYKIRGKPINTITVASYSKKLIGNPCGAAELYNTIWNYRTMSHF